MLDCKVQGFLLTVGDRINRRITNFTTVCNNEIEEDYIKKEDFNKMMSALQKMVSHEVGGALKRRGER